MGNSFTTLDHLSLYWFKGVNVTELDVGMTYQWETDIDLSRQHRDPLGED